MCVSVGEGKGAEMMSYRARKSMVLEKWKVSPEGTGRTVPGPGEKRENVLEGRHYISEGVEARTNKRLRNTER